MSKIKTKALARRKQSARLVQKKKGSSGRASVARKSKEVATEVEPAVIRYGEERVQDLNPNLAKIESDSSDEFDSLAEQEYADEDPDGIRIISRR